MSDLMVIPFLIKHVGEPLFSVNRAKVMRIQWIQKDPLKSLTRSHADEREETTGGLLGVILADALPHITSQDRG